MGTQGHCRLMTSEANQKFGGSGVLLRKNVCGHTFQIHLKSYQEYSITDANHVLFYIAMIIQLTGSNHGFYNIELNVVKEIYCSIEGALLPPCPSEKRAGGAPVPPPACAPLSGVPGYEGFSQQK